MYFIKKYETYCGHFAEDLPFEKVGPYDTEEEAEDDIKSKGGKKTSLTVDKATKTGSIDCPIWEMWAIPKSDNQIRKELIEAKIPIPTNMTLEDTARNSKISPYRYACKIVKSKVKRRL